MTQKFLEPKIEDFALFGNECEWMERESNGKSHEIHKIHKDVDGDDAKMAEIHGCGYVPKKSCNLLPDAMSKNWVG